MKVWLYKLVRAAGRLAFGLASRSLVLHRERAEREGAFILAANHASAFDVPLLILSTRRLIHWLSIAELFQRPLSRWFMTSYGAMPLDRGKVDTATVRSVVRQLRAGHVVGMFPEGGFRAGEESVLRGGTIDDGICKLAQIARVPVIPAVVAGSEKFRRWFNWLPLRRTRWIVVFGEPIFAPFDENKDAAIAGMARAIEQSMRALDEEVSRYV